MGYRELLKIDKEDTMPTNVDISGKDTSKSGLGFDALPEGQLPSGVGLESDTEYMGAGRAQNIVPDPVLGYRDKNAPFRVTEMGGIYDPLTKKLTTDETDVVSPREQELINMQGYANRIDNLVEGEPVIISNINQPIGPADSTETSRIISSKSGLEQSLFGLADTEKEFVDVLNQKLGEGNFRYKFDKDAALFEPKYYVSVKREDGSFTPYSTVTKTFTDGLARASMNLSYEAGASIAVFAGATAVATMVGAAPAVGLLLAPVVLGYSLYMGGKGKEAFRTFIKDQGFNIRDEDLNPAMDFLDKITSIVKPGGGTSMEELSGLLETIPLAGRLKSTIMLMKDSVSKKLSTYLKEAATPGNYESAIKSSDVIKASKVDGSDLNVGIPLENLIFAQIKDNVIIQRISSLASQTTAVIPGKVRDQMQSAVSYLNKFKENVGQGNFKQFKDAVNNVGTYYQTVKSKVTDKNFKDLGTSLIELENIFKYLRGKESEGLYNKVFSKTEGAVYNLDTIRQIIPNINRDIIPITEGKKKGVKAELFPEIRGEAAFNNLTRVFMKLGKLKVVGDDVVEETGKVTGGNLNRQQVTAAIKAFKKLYPNENIDFSKVGTNPARILQIFASRYGKMAREIYREGLPTYNPTLAKNSMVMRNAILDLIGKPNKEIKGLATDLKVANSHYKQTYDLTSAEPQVAISLGAKPGPAGIREPGEGPTSLIGSRGPGSPGPSVSPTVTISNMADMEDYVTKELAKLNDTQVAEALKSGTKTGRDGKQITVEQIKGLTNLRETFKNIINTKIQGLGQRNIDETLPDNAVVSYLNSFDTAALRKLGISEVEEAEFRASSRTITELNRGGFRDTVGADLASDTPFENIIVNMFNRPDEITTTLTKMLDVANTAKQPMREIVNIRRGLLNAILSFESGVFKPVTQNAPTGRIGTDIIDSDRFLNLTRQIQTMPIFKDILRPDDFKVLDGLSTYVATVQRSGTDAGSALSGAQLIGNLFTLDPMKFISGLTRLSAQKNISRLFTDETFVDIMSGLSARKQMTSGEKLKEYFFGKGAVGQAIATIALNIEKEKNQSPAIDQTKDMLSKKDRLQQGYKYYRP